MIFDSVACDWLSFRHDYPDEVEPRNGGRVMKLTPEGEISWMSESWETVRCISSDTSLRVKCDGKHLYGSANIGRFQQADNREGLSVMQCIERWRDVLKVLGYDTTGFGTRDRVETLAECGTHLTRIDLCGNFSVSDYSAFVQGALVRRIGQKLPFSGKYGPTWGYDAKRANWWKAKIYDKEAELAGKRRSEGGATMARFEVQLGSEYLKQNGLDRVTKWKGADMAKIIFGRFAQPVFRESTNVQTWAELPPKLRTYAVLWREGTDIRTMCSKTTYYRVRKELLEHGIDIGTPCNVLALTRKTRIVEITPLPALRQVS